MIRANHLLRASLVLSAITALPAQTRLEPRMLKQQLPTTPGGVLVAFDADGDGDAELVTGGSSLRLYDNDGAGNLSEVTATHLPSGLAGAHPAHVADFDGDGDLDLLLLQANGSVHVLVQMVLLDNDGQGHFTNVSTNSGLLGFSCHSLAVGDLDGDGDLDISVASRGYGPGAAGAEYVFVNDGSAQFVEEGALRLPPSGSTAKREATVMADLDGDSDLDLVFTLGWLSPTTTRVYENDGAGNFVVATTIQMPATMAGIPQFASDVDEDGDQDLLVGGATSGLLRNDGAGAFTFDAGMPAVASWGTQPPTLVDIDADGDLDVVRATQLLVQTPAGAFVDESIARGLRGATGGGACAVDWDGDGDFDLTLGDGVRYLNDGQGHFHATWAARAPTFFGRIAGAAVADLDGNGELDIATGPTTLMQFEGRLVDVTSASDPQQTRQRWIDTVAGDFDGDGDVDLAGCQDMSVSEGSWPVLALNDGSGAFHPAPMPVPANLDAVRRVACADFDGDGDLDLIYCGIAMAGCSGSDQPTRLYLNDGAATFTEVTATHLPTPLTASEDVAHGDLDGDGDLDLVLARDGTNQVYLNDGTATFVDASATSLPAMTNVSASVALVDGDGDLDLFVGNDTQDRLLLNDGAGHFTDVSATHLPVGAESTRDVRFADVDRDGDVDALLSTWAQVSGQGQFVLQNDGAGHFVDMTFDFLAPTSNPTVAMVVADLDADGDADLIRIEAGRVEPWQTCQGGGWPSGPLHPLRASVLTNMTTQLEVPSVPQLGQPLTVRAFARGRDTAGTDLALLGVSPQPVSIAASIGGVLGVDLDQLVLLAGIPVPRATGEGSLTISVPNLPALADVDLYMQAVVLSDQQAAQLTNLLHERVIP